MPDPSITDEELSEVLGTPPSILVRYGNGLLLLLIFILAGLTVIIHYPDYITGAATLQARSAALIQSPPHAGKLGTLFVKNGESVYKGQPLCTIIHERAAADTVKATAGGVVEFQRLLHSNDPIDAAATLYFIRDPQEHYKVEIQAPLARSGSIRPGQTVYISFEQFPAQEYGEIEARILSNPVAHASNKEWVIMEASLLNGLRSTNGRRLAITSQATGQASVILSKKPLITKFWPL
jgi:hypothetical protein